MKKPETIYENLYFTTVRLESYKDDVLVCSGTAFFVSYIIKENNINLFLITNNHVIDGSNQWKMLFNLDKNDSPKYGETANVDLADLEGLNNPWIQHKKYDIAILPFSKIFLILDKNNKKPFIRTLDYKDIPDDNEIEDKIDAIEEVLFVGYPTDVYDRKNLIPIVRKGTTATPVSLDFEDKPLFLIDGSVFPGSSGSPVVICDIAGYREKKGGFNFGTNRIYFLGILTSVYIHTENKEIESIDIPSSLKQFVKTDQMIDLGTVIKSSVIKEMIDDYMSYLNK